jgi:hypothetical protein
MHKTSGRLNLPDVLTSVISFCRFVKQVGHDAKQDKIAENYN